jgi:hypothetical protein
VLKSGFHAKAGSNLHIKIEAPTTNVASAPQRVASKISSDETDSAENRITSYTGVENVTNEVQSTYIYSISGQLLYAVVGNEYNMLHLPIGMYVLKQQMNNGESKIVKIAHH